MRVPGKYHCDNCAAEVKGTLEDNICSVCGKKLCMKCLRTKGGFLGLLGGTKYCPICIAEQ